VTAREHPFGHGRLAYIQIPALDVNESAAFYKDIFGWQIRGGSAAHLSFTDAAGDIIGHLLLSPCPVEDDAGTVGTTVLAIGPVAVRPSAQRRGVGAALMYAAMSLAIARGAPALVLLGHADYYPRFGFESARGVGLQPPADEWPDHVWMARRLPAWDESMRGTVRYPEAFGPLA